MVKQLAAYLVLLALLGFSAAPAPQVSVVATLQLAPQVDVFRNTSTVYTMTGTPAVPPMVFVNGLLMTPKVDYLLLGSAISFTNPDIGQLSSPVVQIFYYKAAP